MTTATGSPAPLRASPPFVARLRRAGSAALQPLLAVLVALVIGAIIIMLTNGNPIIAYQNLLFAAFTSSDNFFTTVAQAVPLVFTGLAAAMSFRSGIFNIGVEGQLLMGGLATAWFALTFATLPAIALVPLSLLSGMLVGVVWSAIPGIMKAYGGANELVSTIMFNYIASAIALWAVAYPMKDPSSGSDQTRLLTPQSYLYQFSTTTQLNTGLFLAIGAVIGIFFLLYHTTLGYEIRMVGLNAQFARYGGVNARRVLVRAMVVSGALGGLCGGVEVLGVFQLFNPGDLAGAQWGFNGIVIALLARLEPLGVPFAAFGYAALQTGGTQMETNTNVHHDVVFVIQAIIILFITVRIAWTMPQLRGRLGKRRPTAQPGATKG